MAVNPIKTSFAAGELSPKMFGRPDFAKYDAGAAKLDNFIVHRIGGISNRPGFLYIDKTPADGAVKVRLLPFKYSVEQVYVLEVSSWGFRFYLGDGLIYSIQKAVYLEEELGAIKYTQSADVMFLFHKNHPIVTITRTGIAAFEVEETGKAFDKGPFEDEWEENNGAEVPTLTVRRQDTAFEITFQTISSSTIPESKMPAEMTKGRLLGLKRQVQGDYRRVNPKTEYANSVVKVIPGGSVYVESFGFWNGTFYLQKYDKDTGAWENVKGQYGNRAGNYNFTEENKTDEIVSFRLYSTDFDNSVHSGEASGQVGCVTIQAFGGEYMGVLRLTSDASYYGRIVGAALYSATAEEVTALYEDLEDGSAAEYTTYCFGAWSEDNYPVCGGFFEERLCIAGTRMSPQTVWMSQQGDYWNFQNVRSEDYEAVSATLAGGEMNGIKAMAAFDVLILMTSGGEYKVTGNGKAVTPSNCFAQAQEYCGISEVNPVLIASRLVYVQQQGSLVRDLAYAYDVDRYTGGELSLLAEHLFRRHKIVAMAYQQVPDSVVWMVRDDGTLLGLTYIKEQDVYAWHQHHTDGEFVDVCCIAGEKYDQLWAVVKRSINGVTRYYVERAPFRELYETSAEQIFADSAYVYGFGHSSDPAWPKVNYVDGLTWLEGRTVAILADGNVLPPQEVYAGTVALGAFYRTVVIGLPYRSEMVSMPVSINGADGSFLGRKQRVNSLSLMFEKSRGGMFGIDTEDDDGKIISGLEEIKWRSNEAYGASINLYTGKKKVNVPNATWGKTVQVRVVQEDPLPLSVLGIIPEVVAGG